MIPVRTRAVTLAGAPCAPVVPMCTIRRTETGWVPVLHSVCQDAPEPSLRAASFTDVAAATRFVRTQYGAIHVAVDGDVRPPLTA
ncbi:MAG: hypothetical protein WBQ50_03750 [Nocardioides sp.]